MPDPQTDPIPLPPRVPLAILPTPIQRLVRAPAAFGLPDDVELWIKRDDLTGFLLSGNKVRKLEYLFAEAQAQGADHVITEGGIQSNHCRATAVAARQLGMDSTLLLRRTDPDADPGLEGNVLIDRMIGAKLVGIRPGEDWRNRTTIREQAMRALRDQGRTPYFIPVGGSSGLGAVGYVAAAFEIAAQLAAGEAGGAPFDAIAFACGSGGTAAGLRLGAALCASGKLPEVAHQILAFAVCDSTAFFNEECPRIEQAALDHLTAANGGNTVSAPTKPPLVVDERFIGPGYAASYPAMLNTIARLAESEAVLLDPVYSGKAWHGLMQLLRDRESLPGAARPRRVLFIHTGGVFGMMPAARAAELAPHLPNYNGNGD